MINLRGNEIAIRFAYNPAIVDLVRTLPDRKWNGAPLKYWTVPATPWHCRQVIRVLGKELEIGPDVLMLARKDQKDWNNSTLDLSVGELTPRPYQAGAVEFLDSTGGRAIIGDDIGCIDGDAEVIINRGGGGARVSLSVLYEKFNGISGGWDLSIPTRTRSLNERTDELRLNTIRAVLDKGQRDCVELVLSSGKRLCMTEDHQVYSEIGWCRASRLNIGDVVFTNGQSVCPICGSTEDIVTYRYARFVGYCRTCVYRYLRDADSTRKNYDAAGYVNILGLYHHPYCKLNGQVLEHRLVVEACLNEVPLDVWIDRCRFGRNLDDAVFLPPDKIVHHIDKIKDHNVPDNLEVMDTEEHAVLHVDVNRLSEFMTAKPDRVVSIEFVGKRHVYDIVMEDPYRSFVANGIVVHNCGKTIEAISYARFIGEKKFLVVCPASVLYKWEREIKAWYPEVADRVMVVSTGATQLGGTVHVISYDMMRRRYIDLKAFKYNLIIFDEFHKLRNWKTQQFKAAKVISDGTPKLVGLSGTPVFNRPRELYNMLNMINERSWGWYGFFHRYCGWNQKGDSVNGATNLQELEERLRGIMLRRFKRDVSNQLPSFTRTVVPLELNDQAMRNYRLLESEDPGIIKRLFPDSKGYFANHLDWFSAMRQFLEQARAQHVADWAEDFLESATGKLVIYCGFKSTVRFLAEFLERWGVTEITGDVPNKERQVIIDRWQNTTQERVMLLTSAGGEGIDLFGKGGIDCSTLLFAGREWSPAVEEQIEGRLDRTGQTFPVEAVYLVAKGTVDEVIHQLIEHKREVIKSAVRSANVETSIVPDLVEVLRRRGVIKKEVKNGKIRKE